MNDGASIEQSIPKEATAPDSWVEIRNKYLNSSYSEIYQAAMGAFKTWEANPDSTTPDWVKSNGINEQMAKAQKLPNVPRKNATTRLATTVDKISTAGNEVPESGQENMTRIYIGADPRKATDAYVALLDALEANGVLKDIDASLNMEELREGTVQGNMMIIYEPMSRPEVLDKVLEAYRTARQNSPEAFALTPQQKARIMRWNLRQFHGTIDANVSFVEQPAIRGGRSFDTIDAIEIQKAFGIGALERGKLSDYEWLEKTKKREGTGVVLDTQTRYKFDRQQIKAGDALGYERKLSAPAIVQTGTFAAKEGF